jgi:hypothetical protein
MRSSIAWTDATTLRDPKDEIPLARLVEVHS